MIQIDDRVTLRAASPEGQAPTLRGDTADLVEALSICAPLPAGTPPEWRTLAATLAKVFDTELAQ